jgi:hypothetical protein
VRLRGGESREEQWLLLLLLIEVNTSSELVGRQARSKSWRNFWGVSDSKIRQVVSSISNASGRFGRGPSLPSSHQASADGKHRHLPQSKAWSGMTSLKPVGQPTRKSRRNGRKQEPRGRDMLSHCWKPLEHKSARSSNRRFCRFATTTRNMVIMFRCTYSLPNAGLMACSSR